MDQEWREVGPGTPCGAWLETRREGEEGTNVCLCRIIEIGGEPEWIERETGATTVTHSTFAPPTHWRWPARDASPTMTGAKFAGSLAGLIEAAVSAEVPRADIVCELQQAARSGAALLK